jgi:hypothetical protein
MSSAPRQRTTPATKVPYTAGHFHLAIDGHATTAYLKSIDGGHVRAALIDEPIGPENLHVKHTSTVEIEPISVEFGISGAGDILKWIQASWKKDWSRRNGEITHANFDLKSTYSHQFLNALITETTFPALDGASREAAYMKMKFLPEVVITTKQSGPPLPPGGATNQKTWIPSAFRLTLDGMDELQYTNKIESFTIKQGVKKLYTGQERFPQIEPTKIEFPNLVGTIALEYADKLLEWGNTYIRKGQRDTSAQKTGQLEFLSPDRKTTLFRINLYEVGLHNLQVMQSTANSDQIKRAKYELYVGYMELDGKGLGVD